MKNNCNDLYLHSKSFKTTLKPNSYLMSLSRRSPVNPSTATFLNINLTQAIANLVVASKINQKSLQ